MKNWQAKVRMWFQKRTQNLRTAPKDGDRRYPTFNQHASRQYIFRRLKSLSHDPEYEFQEVKIKWLIGEIEALQLEKQLLTECYDALAERSRLAYEASKIEHEFKRGT